jgi:predicted DNA-binding antitoxin AbrB/MazE fold protein
MKPDEDGEEIAMTTSITAVYEGGLLRPTTPLTLAEGTHVQLMILRDETDPSQGGRAAANTLAEIAGLSAATGDPRTSQDHDQILYGERDAG